VRDTDIANPKRTGGPRKARWTQDDLDALREMFTAMCERFPERTPLALAQRLEKQALADMEEGR
jgi:hypothetical protein